METNRPAWTLGAASLGLILCGVSALGAPGPADRGIEPPLRFPCRTDLADSGLAQRFGWAIPATETDPTVWAQLRGVGPVLAGRIADRAALGFLRSPADLLQVRGIGIKMAHRLEPWVLWSGQEHRLRVGSGGQEGND